MGSILRQTPHKLQHQAPPAASASPALWFCRSHSALTAEWLVLRTANASPLALTFAPVFGQPLTLTIEVAKRGVPDPAQPHHFPPSKVDSN